MTFKSLKLKILKEANVLIEICPKMQYSEDMILQ